MTGNSKIQVFLISSAWPDMTFSACDSIRLAIELEYTLAGWSGSSRFIGNSFY